MAGKTRKTRYPEMEEAQKRVTERDWIIKHLYCAGVTLRQVEGRGGDVMLECDDCREILILWTGGIAE